VATYSDRTTVIAGNIEHYLTNHPRAVDTPEGIRSWWLKDRQAPSLAEVQMAVDYLVEIRRLSRIILVDGTIVYGSPPKPLDPAKPWGTT
jgi:hypothetical protein